MVEGGDTGGVAHSQVGQRHEDIVWQTSVSINENFAVTSGALFNNYFHKLISVGGCTSAIMEAAFDPFRAFSDMRLSSAGLKMKCLPNAGGSSVISEVLSYELLRNCFGAELERTEMELTYFPEGGSMVDYTCRLFKHTVGVSVTRAMKHSGVYEAADAERLLVKKLEGAILATKNSLHRWSRRLLHVWASSERVAAIVQHAYHDLVPRNLRVNTIVLVTVATGRNSHDIFYEQSSCGRKCQQGL